MYKAEFEVEFITPAFIRSADQTKAELRTSSIKGAMHWWFRALAGSYFGDDVVSLRKAEEYVFGSTNRRSKVILGIKDYQTPYPINSKVEMIKIKYNKKQCKYELVPKISPPIIGCINNRESKVMPSYLLFSIKMKLEELAKESLENILKRHEIRNSFKNKNSISTILKKKGIDSIDKLREKANEVFQEKIKEIYYPAGSSFKLVLTSYDEKAFFLAVTSLWLLSLFGGIGTRSRRGAGSVQAKLLSIKETLPRNYKDTIGKMFNEYYTPSKVNMEFLSEILDEVKQVLSAITKIDLLREFPQLPKYPVLRSSYFMIPKRSLKFSSQFDALKALEEIYAGKFGGRKYSGGFRFSFADYSLSHSINNLKIQTNKCWREYRYYFGLPLIYQHVGKKRKLSVSAIVSSDSKEKGYGRRASPLILTVKRDENGLYYPVILVLVSEFVPNHDREFKIENIKIKVERRFEEVFSYDEFLEKAKIEKTKLTELFSVFELKEVFP